jgi:hypothetical protein
MKSPWITRALPFGVYILFIVLHDGIASLLGDNVNLRPLIYPIQIMAVVAVLVVFWKSYDELNAEGLNLKHGLWAIAVGILVFILWIQMDWHFATMGTPEPFNPNRLPSDWIYPFFAFRLLGASIVVPIFEELFWRSFILRYLINPDFQKVEIGAFSWLSFGVSSLLFGLEHHFWLAGIMAGVFYNLLLYKTKNLYYCIVAHGLTNLILGVYVIESGEWKFW